MPNYNFCVILGVNVITQRVVFKHQPVNTIPRLITQKLIFQITAKARNPEIFSVSASEKFFLYHAFFWDSG